MGKTTFNQRFGIDNTKPIENDFPKSAKIGLAYIIQDLINCEYIISSDINSWAHIYRELQRISKQTFEPITENRSQDQCFKLIESSEWYKIFMLCERIYNKLLKEKAYYNSYHEDWILEHSLEHVQRYFENEINNLLKEENIGYQFLNGEFSRLGRIQTQKNINQAAAVLANPKLFKVKNHFNKAYHFFSDRENPDYQNCVKEAMCALEAAAEISSGLKISKDFVKEIKKLEGNQIDKIPPPIIQSMIKLFGYRGTAEGVSHGNTVGLRIGRLEAELILSMIAACISYLVDFFDEIEPDIKF